MYRPTLMMVFAYLSLLTFGGGLAAAYPKLETLTVDMYHWLTPAQLMHLYGVGQTAPGPNMMMVTAIGERGEAWTNSPGPPVFAYGPGACPIHVGAE